MIIRHLTERDVNEYIAMAGEFYRSDAVLKNMPEKNFYATVKECLSSSPYAKCFILEEDGKIMGYGLILLSFSQEAGGTQVWFDELYIKKEYRGKGFGRQFFNFVFNDFPAARYRLEVEKSNSRAVKLYETLGFEFLEYDQMILDNNQSD